MAERMLPPALFAYGAVASLLLPLPLTRELVRNAVGERDRGAGKFCHQAENN